MEGQEERAGEGRDRRIGGEDRTGGKDRRLEMRVNPLQFQMQVYKTESGSRRIFSIVSPIGPKPNGLHHYCVDLQAKVSGGGGKNLP